MSLLYMTSLKNKKKNHFFWMLHFRLVHCHHPIVFRNSFDISAKMHLHLAICQLSFLKFQVLLSRLV